MKKYFWLATFNAVASLEICNSLRYYFSEEIELFSHDLLYGVWAGFRERQARYACFECCLYQAQWICFINDNRKSILQDNGFGMAAETGFSYIPDRYRPQNFTTKILSESRMNTNEKTLDFHIGGRRFANAIAVYLKATLNLL